MSGVRIEFPSDDAARFNELRDRWRGVAAGHPLSRSGLRVAAVLPTFLSREYGYAFPTDEQLMAELHGSVDTVKRGLSALEAAELIQRKTRVKRDEKGEAAGRERRIFLCLPSGSKSRSVAGSEGATGREVKVQKSAGSEGGKPSEVKVHPEVKGQKRGGEGAYGCTNIPDRTTPDFKIRSGDRKVSVYEGIDPSVAPSPRADPSARPPLAEQPATVRSDRTVEPMHGVHELPEGVADRAPLPRNPYPSPKAFGDDFAFLDAFDRFVVEIAGDDVPAGEISRITAEAFDRATDSDDGFMPFHWESVVALRDDGGTANWFRWRAGSLIHRKAAA